MIVELQIRNCTGTILHYRVVDLLQNYNDLSNQVLPGMYPNKENSGYTSSDIYMKDVEMRKLMSWTPRLKIDQRSGTSRNPVSREQPQHGTIPCNMRKSIFLDDINNKIQLYCMYKGRYYIGDVNTANMMNFNLLVGLIRKENIAYTTKKYNDSPEVIGDIGRSVDTHNIYARDYFKNKALYEEKHGDFGYIMYFDCCGNTLIINSSDNEYQSQGLQEVPRNIYEQFLSNTKFNIVEYLGTPREMLRKGRLPNILSHDIKPSITGHNIGLNYYPLEFYDSRNIDYYNRNRFYLNPAKLYSFGSGNQPLYYNMK
jgi:hypothetical protein